MTLEAEINWKGPFTYGERSIDSVPDEPAIYLWTVEVNGQYRVVYVGETSCLLSRWSDHLILLLGGSYLVYDSVKLREGELKLIYSIKNRVLHLTEFLNNYSLVAAENARIYRLWYGSLVAPEFRKRSCRMSIESGIQWHLKRSGKAGEMVTNNRISISNDIAYRVHFTNQWPPNVDVLGLPDKQVLEYGSLELPIEVPDLPLGE